MSKERYDCIVTVTSKEEASRLDAIYGTKELVRCKNCKWRRKWKDEKNSYHCAKDNIAILGNLKPNFYCGYGKRRKKRWQKEKEKEK